MRLPEIKRCRYQIVDGIDLAPLLNDLISLDVFVTCVLLTAPSLRSDNPPSFDDLSKALRGEAQDLCRAERHTKGYRMGASSWQHCHRLNHIVLPF